MTKICAWCGKFLGSTKGKRTPKIVSHGICPYCLEREVNKYNSEGQIMRETKKYTCPKCGYTENILSDEDMIECPSCEHIEESNDN